MRTRQATLVRSLLLVIGLGLLFPWTEALASEGECHRKIKEDVISLLDPSIAVIKGKATLCINRRGVSGSMEVEHLQPGNAYTVWFSYIDDLSPCVGAEDPSACLFGGDKPLGVFGRYDSAIGPADGEEEFAGRVRGLRLSSGSQVQLVLLGHGPADTTAHSHLARQLLTPEDPAAGAPHLGNVVDGPRFTPTAIAIFNIP
jgi:hypothetical protein